MAAPSTAKMERITDKIAALPQDSTYFSLEFFPPKTSTGMHNLRERLDRMALALRPMFVTVTWGAGGSTAAKSLELAEMCQSELGLTTCLHLTCTNMSRKLVDETLKKAKALGIRNILALRGDEPRGEYRDKLEEAKRMAGGDEEAEFVWAIDLVRYIRRMYGDYFCLGVAAYPEGHADGSHPKEQSLEHDLPYLVEKVKAGADFIMTQLFYDTDAYDAFERRLREHESGAFREIPIIPGLMPIQSYQILKRTTKLSNAKLPRNIEQRLDAVKNDDDMVKKVGVEVISEIVERIKTIKERTKGPKGFHFYTLNLEKSVAFILQRTNLLPSLTPPSNASAVDDSLVALPQVLINGTKKTRRQSSIGSDPHNHVIVDRKDLNRDVEATAEEAAIPKEEPNTRANTLAISEGEGALGREATWDDFPNGRWGDSRSPAYTGTTSSGVYSYSPSLLSVPPAVALELWNHPKTSADITSLFVRYLSSDLEALPWSDEPITEETQLIKHDLVALNKKGWWTVASQPAVNGIRSSDPVLGWGPPGGWCFQKAFVEMFVPAKDFQRLRDVLDETEEVSFLAQSATGEFVRKGGNDAEPRTDAVTWGVFPGKEIVSPTIVEEESFRSWAGEAWGVWGEWAAVMDRQADAAESRTYLEWCGQDGWLVNVIWHDFVGMCKSRDEKTKDDEEWRGYKGLWEALVNA